MSISQRFFSGLIFIGIYFLRLIELLESLSIWRQVKLVLVTLVSFIFVVFLLFSFYSGFFSDLALGIFDKNLRFIPTDSYIAKAPRKTQEIPTPNISAKAAIVVDRASGKVLFEKDIHHRFPPASTAKLMTSLVVLDFYDFNEILEVSENCAAIESTKAWLLPEMRVSVKDLFNSMLIGSAGDSACVLASSKIKQEDFVKLMNKKGIEIGLRETHFTNPVGLDSENGEHYSTAWDLYKLANYAVQHPEIAKTVATKKYVLNYPLQEYYYEVTNTNQLLWEINNSVGVKTGTTEGAGEVLIYEYNDTIKDLFIIVMGSEHRFFDTKELLYWVNQSYSWD